MATLTKETVRVKADAKNKVDAIEQAGKLLVRAGAVPPSYVRGMLARERVLSTYLGNGIAIPHGGPQDLEFVYCARVSVLQLPKGVEWQPGEKAYLVIGLAAKSDELASLLSNLLEILHDPQTIEELVQTSDPMTVVARLGEKE